MPEIAPKNCHSYLAVWQQYFRSGRFCELSEKNWIQHFSLSKCWIQFLLGKLNNISPT